MDAKDLPGELESDMMILGTRAEMLIRSSVKLGEMKARVELFQLIRDAMSEKNLAGDEIAAQVLEWLWLELADKYQVDLPD